MYPHHNHKEKLTYLGSQIHVSTIVETVDTSKGNVDCGQEKKYFRTPVGADAEKDVNMGKTMEIIADKVLAVGMMVLDVVTWLKSPQ